MTELWDRLGSALFAIAAGMFGGMLLGTLTALLRSRGLSVLVAAALLVAIVVFEVARRRASASMRIAAGSAFFGFVLTLIVLAPR